MNIIQFLLCKVERETFDGMVILPPKLVAGVSAVFLSAVLPSVSQTNLEVSMKGIGLQILAYIPIYN